MDWKFSLLERMGYQLQHVSGHYCRAFRGEQEVVLRWTGEAWRVM